LKANNDKYSRGNHQSGDFLWIKIAKASVFPMALAKDLTSKLLGITVEDITANRPYHFRMMATEGVVISDLQQQSYLFRIGARRGDVIRQVDDIPIKNTKDFEKAIVKYRSKSSVVMLLQRENELYYVTVKPRIFSVLPTSPVYFD